MSEAKKNILVIDDSIATLTTIRSIIEKSYEVSLAKDAEIAKTILDTATVDLILLDMEMPDFSGMEFLTMLNNSALWYHIPVIIVSSHGTADVIINSRKNGAIDFVVKPIHPRVLIDKIHSVFKSSKTKISKTGLFRKLQILENSCVMGKSNKVEDIIQDLEKIYFDLETDTEIAEICKFAKNMDYKLVGAKIKPLLSSLSKQ
jgi:two-component system nitrogen regulation response regulator NtrX